jgi:hypothetical protein
MAELPAGTVIEIRLLTPVSSYYSKPGDEVRGLVVAPICAQPGGTVPTGAIASGILKHIHKVGLGLVHETARVELEFRELRLPDGQTYPLRGRLVSVDNARERVDRHGSIHGDRATASLSHRFGSRLAFAAFAHPIFLFPVLALENGIFHFPDPEINFGPGTELHLKVDDALPLCPATDRAMTEPVSQDDRLELYRLVTSFPYWTYSRAQREPSDPTNLVFIGSRQELDRAFNAAGWAGSRALSMATGLQLIRAVAESRAYAEAPVRMLLLDGAEPDITRQKALNTFTKRHHLRIWKRTDLWQGRPVWVSAATKDVAASFSLKPFGFTHQIENEVDRERDKVVSDIVFTGCVDSIEYVARPEMLRDWESEHRRGVWTDSQVAVLTMNSCEPLPHSQVMEVWDRKPALAVRSVRRITLTVRNHFIRENLPWRIGEGAVFGYRAVRNWHEQRTSEKRAQLAASENRDNALRQNNWRSGSGAN